MNEWMERLNEKTEKLCAITSNQNTIAALWMLNYKASEIVKAMFATLPTYDEWTKTILTADTITGLGNDMSPQAYCEFISFRLTRWRPT